MNKFVVSNKTSEGYTQDEVLETVPKSFNLSQKMEFLSEKASLTEQDHETRIALVHFIKSHLQFYFPKCQILVYGSSVNGLGTKGCDLDLLFLPYPKYSNTVDDPIEKVNMHVRICDLRIGKIAKPFLRKLDEPSLLKFVKQVLHRIRVLRSLIFIPAKCPILNFVTSEPSITCDLSASNRLVCCNSALIKLFLHMDRRVRPLIMTLRFWGKKLQFIKCGEFSSYAFTLLVVFFLQNTESSILPSVKKLVESSGFSRKIDGWECSFIENLDHVPPSDNVEALGTLLFHFFEFYLQFDFHRNVASLHSGQAIQLKEFLNSSDERLKEFKVSSVCLQDPFILSRNVSGLINPYMLYSLKASMIQAYHILKNEKNDDGFKKFLTMDRVYFKNLFTEEKIVILIPFKTDAVDCIDNKDNVNYIWYYNTSWAIHEILKIVLLFECEIIDMDLKISKSFYEQYDTALISHSYDSNIMNGKISSLTANCDTCLDLELLMSIQCIVYYRTWHRRNSVNVDNVDDSLSRTEGILNPVLRQEHFISKSLLSGDPLLSSSEPLLQFKCDIFKQKFNLTPDVIVTLQFYTQPKEQRNVGNFLKSYLPKTVISYLTSLKNS